MNRIELDVGGMTCGGCSSRLKRVLEATAGVKAAEVVLETGRVTVDYVAADTGVDAIRTAIEDAGFTVRTV